MLTEGNNDTCLLSTAAHLVSPDSYDRLADPPMNPDGTPMERFEILEPDGIGGVGCRIEQGSIYLNKQSPVNTSTDVVGNNNPTDPNEYKPTPLSHKSTNPAYIDKVHCLVHSSRLNSSPYLGALDHGRYGPNINQSPPQTSQTPRAG
jgi:DNA-directed RNA polymerase beta subunit